MNERIQELVKQAWAERDLISANRALDDAFTDKFAELLIKDCVGIADEYDGVGSTIVDRIKKHFGIEDKDNG